MKASLAVAALAQRHHHRNPVGTVVHFDRGSSISLERTRPDDQGRRPGRVDGTGHSLRGQRRHRVTFALLRKKVLDRQDWNTREELRLAIITWIERTDHRRRRQRRLGRLTPVAYETLTHAATAA